MKLFLLIALFLIFVIFAIVIYLKYYYKYLIFKDMVFICKYFMNNIEFNKNCIEQVYSELKSKISSITRNVVEQLDVSKNYFILKKEDVLDINTFFKSLGNGDVKYEISNIKYFENEFENKKNMAYELLNKDGKMYLKLLIGVGLAVCIILI